MPPQHAVWLPPQMAHEVRMVGVTTRSLYIEPAALLVDPPQDCQVVSVTPLMRQLLMAAVDMPLDYDEQGRDGALVSLLLHELANLPPLPLHIPLPADRRLSELCQQFLQHPDAHDSPQAWASRLYMSIRSFSRLFRAQTGMSFSQWRQRALVGQRQRLVDLTDQRVQPVVEIFYLRAIGRFVLQLGRRALLCIHCGGAHVLQTLLQGIRGVSAQHRFVIACDGIHIVGQIGRDRQ